MLFLFKDKFVWQPAHFTNKNEIDNTKRINIYNNQWDTH